MVSRAVVRVVEAILDAEGLRIQNIERIRARVEDAFRGIGDTVVANVGEIAVGVRWRKGWRSPGRYWIRFRPRKSIAGGNQAGSIRVRVRKRGRSGGGNRRQENLHAIIILGKEGDGIGNLLRHRNGSGLAECRAGRRNTG